MGKKVLGWGLACAALLFLIGGCTPSVQAKATEEEAEGAVSVEELVADLDSIGASGARALLPASSIPKPNGEAFTAAELSAYLDGIRVKLAAYVQSRGANRPYLVMPLRLSAQLPNGKSQSGLMWVPVSLGRTLRAPIIAFQHGTQVYRQSAPSRYNANPLAILSSYDVAGAFQNYVECTTAALMATAGYIVVMADYPGFGDSTEPHPYVQLSLGESVLTILNRAQAVLKNLAASARPNGKVYLIGYSEGGFVSMAAARPLREAGYQVVAAVPCAGSYDLSGAMLADILADKEAVSPYYLPYTVYGYASSYRGTGLPGDPWYYGALLQPPVAAKLDYFFGGGQTSTAINAAIASVPGYKVIRNMLADGLADQLRLYLNGSPPTDPTPTAREVYDKLAKNTVFHTDWMPDMLIQMVHCPTDDVVPFGNAVNTYWAYHSGVVEAPNVLPPIQVQPVSLPEELASLADTHLLAYPTAMLAGFAFIDAVNGSL
jgi:Secretory lipase.